MIERIAAMIADLLENGLSGAAGASLIVAAAVSFLIVACVVACMKKSGTGERRDKYG